MTKKDALILELLCEIVSVIEDTPGTPEGLREHLLGKLFDLEMEMKKGKNETN